MTYEEGILGIPKQFESSPELLNKEKIRPYKKVIVLGMGGSRLGADFLNMVMPELDIRIHSDFDLPNLSPEALAESLVIANSYSGETAEIVSGAKKALEAGLNLVIIAGGGQLIELAKQKSLPYIQISHNDLPARLSVGFDVMALVEMLSIDKNIFESCTKIDALALESEGKKVAGQLGSNIPLIYTSERYNELGYMWKIILNETAKIPSFQNRFPEVDHNEIAGFERINASANMHGIFLRDNTDSRIEHRMNAVSHLLLGKGTPVTDVWLSAGSISEQVVSSMILAHWVAVELSMKAGLNPLDSATIEEFKKELND